MPITKRISVSAHSAVFVWKITESETELLQRLQGGNSVELGLMKISAPRKRLEFLAVRCLVEEAIGVKASLLTKNSHGAPEVKSLNKSISISHSYPYVVLAVHDYTSIGVDVERIKPTVVRIKNKFCSPQELKKVGDNDAILTYLWGAKEVAYKVYQKGAVLYKEHIAVEMEGDFPNSFSTRFCKPGQSFTISNKGFKFGDHILVCGHLD